MVVLPDFPKLEFADYNCFMDCTSLLSYTPTSPFIDTIPEVAFRTAHSMLSLTLPDGVKLLLAHAASGVNRTTRHGGSTVWDVPGH